MPSGYMPFAGPGEFTKLVYDSKFTKCAEEMSFVNAVASDKHSSSGNLFSEAKCPGSAGFSRFFDGHIRGYGAC